jgi:regulator of protease activity HflC (stomatin/prohibitin superfamily)
MIVAKAIKDRPADFIKAPVQVVSGIGALCALAAIIVGLTIAVLLKNPVPVVFGFLIGLYLLFSLKVADQWEKVAVLRLGRYQGLRGPGPFHIIPVVDTLSSFVDQRVRVTDVTAESALTRDTVPVNVDAIVFWIVWNAEKCILEVEDFTEAVTLSAQTALRESIGRHELSQMITERELLGRELQKILDEKTNGWGITVQSVEIRDVHIPAALEDAMSRQAQAERERQARIILGTAETEISDKFAQAALVYQDNPIALHLRAMNMLYEALKEKGSMVIVPSSAVETMGLGGTLATASLHPQRPVVQS